MSMPLWPRDPAPIEGEEEGLANLYKAKFSCWRFALFTSMNLIQTLIYKLYTNEQNWKSHGRSSSLSDTDGSLGSY